MTATALGTTPIPGDNPAGFDARYEPEYVDVSTEIGKLGSATQVGGVAWARVVEQGQSILEHKSKDLQIAAYVGVGWQETRGLAGVRDAVDLFLALFGTFWETAFPPLARLRRRTNAFDWWHERACAGLQKYGDAPALPADMVQGLTEGLNSLDRLVGELMPDAAPLRDMLEAVRQLPVVATPAPETPHAAQPVAQSPAPSAPQPTQPTVQPQAPAQSGMAAPSGDDVQAAMKDFAAAGSRYALLAHRAMPEDPLPWQVLRLALWGKVVTLPPATNGQTHIPPPDNDRLEGLYRMLEAGKHLDAALGGEDMFAASLFCFDIQCVIDAALEGLGDTYAEARQRVREEMLRFVRRLEGVELLAFDGGMPFASPETLRWLVSLGEAAPPSAAVPQPANLVEARADTGHAELFAESGRLAADGQLAAALRLLEQAQGDSPAANIPLRVQQLRLLCAARERDIAVTLAQGLLEELDARRVENWDSALAVEMLLAAREAFALGRNREGIADAQRRIARLRPSVALGWKA